PLSSRAKRNDVGERSATGWFSPLAGGGALARLRRRADRLLLGLRRWKADERREELAQDARGQCAQRVDRHIGVVARSAEPVIRRKHALRAAAEQLSEERDIAEQRIDRIGGRDGALQIEAVALGIDPAAGGDADRLAKGEHVLDRHSAAGQREIA